MIRHKVQVTKYKIKYFAMQFFYFYLLSFIF